jgi:glyoxylase-like metal-dependent hydrolase (beta-lactamase superfamily II)
MPTNRIVRLGVINAYLVAEDDGLTLIDALIRGGEKPILAAAERLGAPIVRIAITHAHFDHVGALDALARRLPAAEIAVPARDARLLAGDRSLDPDEPPAKLKPGLPRVATRPSRLLAPGDRLGSLEVIGAPGHSPGQVAYLDPRDGTLYCGDAYTTVGGVATTARPYPPFPFPGLGTWHRPTALESARALRAVQPRALAPGHGRVVADPGPAMDAAIAKV